MAILEAVRIQKRFGGVVALQEGSLSVEAGEAHVLIGSNGCGKSTLCKIIAGSVAADGGELRLDGEPINFRHPAEAAAAGIGVFYQELSLIPQLSVADNIFLGREPRNRYRLVDTKKRKAGAEAALARFEGSLGRGVTPDTLVSDLAADQRQIVEILKVLGENPRIVIFDEPTSSLDNRQVGVFFRLIGEMKAAGKSIIFISHRMDEVFEIGDRVTVLRNGRTITTLTIADTSRDEIVENMVGASITAIERDSAALPSDEQAVLSVRHLNGPHLQDVSLRLRRGEILGLGGLHGQGQSVLLRALFGAGREHHGEILLEGKKVMLKKPADAVAHSIAYISGDRGRDGVFLIRPIFENLVIAALTQRNAWRVARRPLTEEVLAVGAKLKLKFSSLAASIGQLSGGNQQKVVIGRWLAIRPRMLLMDDPTKGIDLQTKHDLYEIMSALCREGVSIILYSSEEQELLDNAHRILVFNGGRVVDELSGTRINELDLTRAAFASAEAGE